MLYQEADAKNSIELLSPHYDIDGQNCVDILWNNENLVYGVSGKVVRLSSFSHRTKEEIDGEVTLLGILWDTKCSVVQIIRSKDGRPSIDIEVDGKPTHVVVFEKAPWSIKTLEDFWESRTKLIREWWRSMWEIHARTAENSDVLSDLERLNWDEEVIIADAEKLLPSEQSEIHNALTDLMQRIYSLPKSPQDFWLVHTDMRPRNFHVDLESITHFDFDDICYHWFAYDIAVSLLHEAEWKESVEERTKFIVDFLQDFMKWYLEENTINPEVFKHLIDLMKLRLFYAYIDYYKRLVIKWVDSGYEKMLVRRWYIDDFESFIDTDTIQREIENFIKK